MYDHMFSLLSKIDAERTHHVALHGARWATPLLSLMPTPQKKVHTMGLTFANPLGLAAGFDKEGQATSGLAALGFSHVEIGTVTAEPQTGNERPRLFRLPQDRALINRMGFNNGGAEALARRLRARGRRNYVLGINVGKTKRVPEENEQMVIDDYKRSVHLLAPHGDYMVINVSSPNTPGLRRLQNVDRLGPLLSAVSTTIDAVVDKATPLLVKIAPDLEDSEIIAIADLVRELKLAGIVACNTTIRRDNLKTDENEVAQHGAGGVSGAPTRGRALQVLRLLRAHDASLTLIGVGGIGTIEDARQRLEAGANLIQAYTGLVYGGPAWPRRIIREL